MSNKKLIREIILERNPDALFLEEYFDEALLGSAIQCGQKHVAIYDSDQCINILMKVLDIGEEEAYEKFQFTTEFSIPSENKPILFSNFSNIEESELPNMDGNMTLEDLL